MQNKKAQVWVETVIYTLIAFVLIGAVLAFVKPKLDEFQDKSIIEQTLTAVEDINNIINSLVQGGSGNKRLLELTINKGILNINGESDELIFEIESRYLYSEPGNDITIGSAKIKTEKKGKFNLVTTNMSYSQKYDITYDKKNINKLLNKAATPYKIAISNDGKNNDGKTKIDFTVI